MAQRRTRVVLSVPWDDESQDHPANWGFDVLLNAEPDASGLGVVVIDFAEVDFAEVEWPGATQSP